MIFFGLLRNSQNRKSSTTKEIFGKVVNVSRPNTVFQNLCITDMSLKTVGYWQIKDSVSQHIFSLRI